MTQPRHFAFRLRFPDWSLSSNVTVTGEAVMISLDRGYLRIERDWAPDDYVTLSLAMPIRRLSAKPELVSDLERVARERGPFIYCVEETDAGGDVERLTIDGRAAIDAEYEPDLLGGTGILRVPVWVTSQHGWGETLYRDAAPEYRASSVRAI